MFGITIGKLIIQRRESKNNMEREMTEGDSETTVTVRAPTVEGITAALGVDIAESAESKALDRYPELDTVLSTLADVYAGVEEATKTDSRGRSRKMVRQFAEREDLSSNAVGHHLRVLEEHGLVEQEGNRWRLGPSETE